MPSDPIAIGRPDHVFVPVIDAAMIPMSAALDFKLIEVAKYYTVEAPLGRSPFLVAMNRARYEKLAPEFEHTSGQKVNITYSGGSGLMLGWAILRPGLMRRRDTRERGHQELDRLVRLERLAGGFGVGRLDRKKNELGIAHCRGLRARLHAHVLIVGICL